MDTASTTMRTAACALASGRDVRDRWLMRAAGFFAFAVIVHNGDHLRRGTGQLRPDVFWVGMSAVLAEVTLVVLVCQRHRLAPLASAVGGLLLAGGYVEVHFLPRHAWLSDSFTSAAQVSPLSWVAASLEVVAALTLAGAGLLVLRRRGGLPSALSARPAQRTAAGALLHPLAALIVLSQLATLVVSFVQAYG